MFPAGMKVKIEIENVGSFINFSYLQLPVLSDLPSPIEPPSNPRDNTTESETESEPIETESEPPYDFYDGSNSIDADPKSEPSTNSEPEANGEGTILISSLVSMVTVFVLYRAGSPLQIF